MCLVAVFSFFHGLPLCFCGCELFVFVFNAFFIACALFLLCCFAQESCNAFCVFENKRDSSLTLCISNKRKSRNNLSKRKELKHNPEENMEVTEQWPWKP